MTNYQCLTNKERHKTRSSFSPQVRAKFLNFCKFLGTLNSSRKNHLIFPRFLQFATFWKFSERHSNKIVSSYELKELHIEQQIRIVNYTWFEMIGFKTSHNMLQVGRVGYKIASLLFLKIIRCQLNARLFIQTTRFV